MKVSRNHHYIPQFFIKEFCDDKDRAYLYNKKKRKFEENKNTSNTYFRETFRPEKIFCIKDLNNISILGSRDDTIEKFLDSNFDSPISKSFQYILKNFDKFLRDDEFVSEMSKKGNEKIFNKQIFKRHYRKRINISYFIVELFCRNPYNYPLIESYLKKHPKQFGFKITAKEGSPEQVKNTVEILNDYISTRLYYDIPDFKKFDVILMSFFEIFNIQNLNSNWRVLWGSKENNLGILAAKPIVYRDFSKLQSLSELFVPISKDKILLFGNNLKIKDIKKSGSCDFFQKLSVFAMAEEFVISTNKEWIEIIANAYYQILDKYGEYQTKDYIINQFFDCFEEEN